MILAMVLFVGNIFYTNHRDDITMEAERDSIRTMFAYEIANNHRALTFLDKTRYIGFDENSEHFVGEWICPYISRHLLSLNPSLAHCRRYSRGER